MTVHVEVSKATLSSHSSVLLCPHLLNNSFSLTNNDNNTNSLPTRKQAVWASKYTDRAYLSTRKVGIPFDGVRMAVLVQRVVPATYAFVIHTTNPTTGDEDEVYCELVRGLGESIVSGTVPGAALAFSARKHAIDDAKVLLYPSKGEGMFVEESLIFRWV
jgi:alpha-glucan, water dikinase